MSRYNVEYKIKEVNFYLLLKVVVAMLGTLIMVLPCDSVAATYQPLSEQQPQVGTSTSSDNTQLTDFSIRNSTVTFSPNRSISTGIPHWNVTVWIEGPAQGLSQIDNVTYHVTAIPSGKTKDLTPIRSDDRNPNFSVALDIVGGFQLNATLNFVDSRTLDIGPLRLRTIIPEEYEYLSVIQLTLNPFMIGQNVTIDGEATSKLGNITAIRVNWGDGKTSIQNKFPFTHTYSSAGSFTIKVTAFSTLSISASQTLQTDVLSLERFITPDASYRISKGQYLLTMYTSSSGIPENSPVPYTVWGNLLYVNGSTIPNIPVNIRIFSIDRPNVYNDLIQKQTNGNGSYTYRYDHLSFEPGQYKILVDVPTVKYAGLNVTKDLFVLARPLSTDQLITYLATAIGTTLAVVGVIVKAPGYFNSIKQANYLSTYIERIHKIYNEFRKDEKGMANKQRYLDDLEEIRNTTVYLLQRRHISESQFNMLDDKISDYQQKIDNNQH